MESTLGTCGLTYLLKRSWTSLAHVLPQAWEPSTRGTHLAANPAAQQHPTSVSITAQLGVRGGVKKKSAGRGMASKKHSEPKASPQVRLLPHCFIVAALATILC